MRYLHPISLQPSCFVYLRALHLDKPFRYMRHGYAYETYFQFSMVCQLAKWFPQLTKLSIHIQGWSDERIEFPPHLTALHLNIHPPETLTAEQATREKEQQLCATLGDAFARLTQLEELWIHEWTRFRKIPYHSLPPIWQRADVSLTMPKLKRLFLGYFKVHVHDQRHIGSWPCIERFVVGKIKCFHPSVVKAWSLEARQRIEVNVLLANKYGSLDDPYPIPNGVYESLHNLRCIGILRLGPQSNIQLKQYTHLRVRDLSIDRKWPFEDAYPFLIAQSDSLHTIVLRNVGWTEEQVHQALAPLKNLRTLSLAMLPMHSVSFLNDTSHPLLQTVHFERCGAFELSEADAQRLTDMTSLRCITLDYKVTHKMMRSTGWSAYVRMYRDASGFVQYTRQRGVEPRFCTLIA